MASTKNPPLNYSKLIKDLKANGLLPVYLLWGEEHYLHELFIKTLKETALASGTEDFNYHKITSLSADLGELYAAVDSLPFMGEKVFIELRDVDFAALKESSIESFKAIIKDLPDYCCLVISTPNGKAPDGRSALVKLIKKQGLGVDFTPQAQNLLVDWIKKRFYAYDKIISSENCELLIYLSGKLMTGLIPEIDKIGTYSDNREITGDVIKKLASHLPEANIFEMTEAISLKKFDTATSIMAELLASGEHPIKILSLMGMQFRRLYALKLAGRSGRSFMKEHYAINYDFILNKLEKSAKEYSLGELKRALSACAESDFQLKSSGISGEIIIENLIISLALGK